MSVHSRSQRYADFLVTLSSAPRLAPESLRTGLALAARAWFEDPVRPRVAESTLSGWDALIAHWIADDSLPLFVRKHAKNRGHEIRHSSGRILVPSDNGPAHWALSLAFDGIVPSTEEIGPLVARDEIPVAMAFKRGERDEARYRCAKRIEDGTNAKGWKVAHIEPIGLGTRTPLTDMPLSRIVSHFRAFVSPRNMFLVPKAYAGAAETPEFLEAFREPDRAA